MLRAWLNRGARVTVAEITGLWIVAAGLIVALALAGCPLTVTGGMALGVVTVSIAWELLTGREERRAQVTLQAVPPRAEQDEAWTERDEAILSGDLSLAAWVQAGQVRQGDAR